MSPTTAQTTRTTTALIKRYLIFDLETRSEVDLRKVGLARYAAHPSTEIMAAAWCVADRFGQILERGRSRTELGKLVRDPDIMIVAHNASFERTICSYIFLGWPKDVFDPRRWICTAALASAFGLPRSLDGAAKALNLTAQKDNAGKRLMLKYSRPRADGSFWNDADDLEQIAQYCEQDVAVTVRLLFLSPELGHTERRVWELDCEINERGFTVDLPLIDAALEVLTDEAEVQRQAFEKLSGGRFTPRQLKPFLADLKKAGCDLPDLKAKTVLDALAGELTPRARALLTLRVAAARSSVKKWEKFKDLNYEGQIFQSMIYCGASTGRWTGAGVQPHNLPRGNLKGEALTKALAAIRTGLCDVVAAETESVPATLSSAIRSVIIPRKGTTFYCGDFAGIEARVLFWLADHLAGLEAFRSGADLYKELAASIYSKPVANIDSSERQLGKLGILGAGFGMGAKKFKIHCANFGQVIDDYLAQKAINTYRTKHHFVPTAWSNFQKGAELTVAQRKYNCTVNHVTFARGERGAMTIELPSGRKLYYHELSLKETTGFMGEPRNELVYLGVNPKTKQWSEIRTRGPTLVENAVQAIARDLMAAAMLRLTAAGFRVVLTVHDEILAEHDEPDMLEVFIKTMAAVPTWAKGLPIGVDGWKGDRYRK